MPVPSKEAFIAYERVRQDGSYNMFDPMAIAISGLDKETYLAVMKDYSILNKLYPEVRQTDYGKLKIETKITIDWKRD